LGRHGTFTALVEPQRETALLGAIVLEDLDLLVDCPSDRVVPGDPNIQVHEIELEAPIFTISSFHHSCGVCLVK
jgi:hypothetical protein